MVLDTTKQERNKVGVKQGKKSVHSKRILQKHQLQLYRSVVTNRELSYTHGSHTFSKTIFHTFSIPFHFQIKRL